MNDLENWKKIRFKTGIFCESIYLNSSDKTDIAINKAIQILEITEEYKKPKLFHINKNICCLLNKTKVPKIKDNLKLPFPTLILEPEDLFISEEKGVMGIILRTQEDKKDILQVIYFICKPQKTTTHVKYINVKTWKLEKDIQTKGEFTRDDKKEFQIVTDFILNILLFLNEPRVTFVVSTTNSKRRGKKGLLPIPSQLITQIEYSLRKEIINITHQSQNKLGYRFWVRGHWRELRSEKYANKQGQKVWIVPHTRGEGMLVPQVFELKA